MHVGGGKKEKSGGETSKASSSVIDIYIFQGFVSGFSTGK